MDLKDRIKLLRKTVNLSQDEFGKRIGVARNTIANYETGTRNPMSQTIISICREYNVNEMWLRTGVGEMLITNTSTEEKITALAARLSKNDKQSYLKALLEVISDLNDEQLAQLEEIGKAILSKIKKEESM